MQQPPGGGGGRVGGGVLGGRGGTAALGGRGKSTAAAAAAAPARGAGAAAGAAATGGPGGRAAVTPSLRKRKRSPEGGDGGALPDIMWEEEVMENARAMHRAACAHVQVRPVLWCSCFAAFHKTMQVQWT